MKKATAPMRARTIKFDRRHELEEKFEEQEDLQLAWAQDPGLPVHGIVGSDNLSPDLAPCLQSRIVLKHGKPHGKEKSAVARLATAISSMMQANALVLILEVIWRRMREGEDVCLLKSGSEWTGRVPKELEVPRRTLSPRQIRYNVPRTKRVWQRRNWMRITRPWYSTETGVSKI